MAASTISSIERVLLRDASTSAASLRGEGGSRSASVVRRIGSASRGNVCSRISSHHHKTSSCIINNGYNRFFATVAQVEDTTTTNSSDKTTVVATTSFTVPASESLLYSVYRHEWIPVLLLLYTVIIA